jgi:hypothetical protein
MVLLTLIYLFLLGLFGWSDWRPFKFCFRSWGSLNAGGTVTMLYFEMTYTNMASMVSRRFSLALPCTSPDQPSSSEILRQETTRPAVKAPDQQPPPCTARCDVPCLTSDPFRNVDFATWLGNRPTRRGDVVNSARSPVLATFERLPTTADIRDLSSGETGLGFDSTP